MREPGFDALPRARRTDPPTSHQAGGSMRESAKAQRIRIHNFLVAYGPHTADEIDYYLGLRPTSAGRRLPELLEHDLVERMPETRPTRSGRPAHLWRVPAEDPKQLGLFGGDS